MTIPVLVRLMFGNKAKFFFDIGPYFGYLIKKMEITEAFHEYPGGKSNHTDNFKRFDFGITTGQRFQKVLRVIPLLRK